MGGIVYQLKAERRLEGNRASAGRVLPSRFNVRKLRLGGRGPARWRVRFRRLIVIGLFGVWIAPAAAYNSEIHKDLYDLAFPDASAVENPVVPPSLEALNGFRQFVFELAVADPSFRERWPRREDFSAYAFKEFLVLNPLRQVVGIDSVPPKRGTDRRTVVREASVDPDTDRRNQDRLHLLPDGTVALDSLGRAVPADPRTVWFGPLVGAGSQFDAHGATLRDGVKGQWMITTLGRPHQYARPKVALGSVPEFSESYAGLAMIARLWGGEGAEWLALTFAGHSLHGIEDLGNQIHTTQIGSHRFYLDTLWAYVSTRFRPLTRVSEGEMRRFGPPERLTVAELNDALERLRTPESIDPRVRFALGLEPTGNPDLKALATRILGSHHRLLEAYMQEQYLESRDAIRAGALDRAKPAVVELIAAAKAGDADFRAHTESALDVAGLGRTPPGSTPFALILAEQVLERSAPEAAPLYESIRAIAIAPLRQAREVYLDGQPPLEFIEPEYTGENEDNRYTRRLWELNAASFARVVTAVRLWFEVFDSETSGVAPGSPEAAARARRVALRLASAQLAAIRRAEERRAAYLSQRDDD